MPWMVPFAMRSVKGVHEGVHKNQSVSIVNIAWYDVLSQSRRTVTGNDSAHA